MAYISIEKRREYDKRYLAKPGVAERKLATNRRRRGLPEPTRSTPEVCEICGLPPGVRRMHLDHCHITGKFRGWLCNNCNRALGHFKDDRVLLRKAMDYLWVHSP